MNNSEPYAVVELPPKVLVASFDIGSTQIPNTRLLRTGDSSPG